MKRATPTPNRFITFTPNWWVKGFVLFVALIFLGSCLDEASLIGFKKSPRFEVKYKEFILPATTIRTDSVRTSIRAQNQYGWESDFDRLLLGQASDPNFGEMSAGFFAKIIPYSAKITGKSQVTLERLTLNLVLDYYVFGDTNSYGSSYSVHEITDDNFNNLKDYFNSTSVNYDQNPLITTTYFYNRDSILKSRQKNSVTANSRIDTIFFDFPTGPDSYAQHLLDTALRKGIYAYSSYYQKDTISYTKTDSVFQLGFKGLAVLPVQSNKIVGIKSRSGYSRLTLTYSYMDNGVKNFGKLYYRVYYTPAYSKIDFTPGNQLQTLTSTNTDFNAPDGYCYLQAGTGIFTKLNIGDVHSFFDTIPGLAINAAEIIVGVEPKTTRTHLKEPVGLSVRLMSPSNRFFYVPLVDAVVGGITIQTPDESFATLYSRSYYSNINSDFGMEGVPDGDATYSYLKYSETTSERYYSGYLSNFLETHLRTPQSVNKISYLALTPRDAPFGKNFAGLSFKKNQVKLKVYYTQTDQ